jgi:hypothetical protein
MHQSPLLTYYVARRNAEEMDRRGPPGRFFRLVMLMVVQIPAALFVLGLAGCALFFVCSFVAWKLGIG